MTLRELREGRWAKLLHRPALKAVIADCGDGLLHREQLRTEWKPDEYVFNISFGRWDSGCRCCQQSARRQPSLVLQINFDRRHNRTYQQLLNQAVLRNDGYQSFNVKAGIDGYSGHPVNFSRGFTMAWVRLDLDLDSGECLIEEVQNDWLRNSEWQAKEFEKYLTENKEEKLEDYYPQFMGHYREFIRYARDVLKSYRAVWAEASLAAALEFIWKELGDLAIYCHSAETGAVLKGIRGSQPPRSLYSSLPEKFGFQLTEDAPVFLKNHRFARRCMKAMQVPVRFYRL
ncbi:hypothetical protein ACNKU7_07070 [Microbulbifer sp. SA54]|uniref:hypothetical protein n=1 Tax=Microbulbifer sp. SA54 TaxID=3401577 RepID=UPI003AAAA1AD